MIAKRVAALALAVALIGGAWIVRDRIDGSDSTTADAGVLVCATEFVALCRAAVPDGVRVAGQDAATTIDELTAADAEPVLWLTFESFPQILNEARERAGAEPFVVTAPEIASSPISVVTRREDSAPLREACGTGDGVDLGCVAGRTASRPAVSPIDSGIGLLAVSAAFAARLGDAIDLQDPSLLPWARAFRRGSDGWDLTAGTAIATQQIRPAIGVAIGVEAELLPTRRDDFDVLYADPMVRAGVVLMQPSGSDVPDGLLSDLTEGLVSQGWERAAERISGTLPDAATMLAIRQYWKDLA